MLASLPEHRWGFVTAEEQLIGALGSQDWSEEKGNGYRNVSVTLIQHNSAPITH